MREKPNKPVVVRQVWAQNLEFEFKLICSALQWFPFAAMDTEFPGTVHRSSVDYRQMKPSDHYRFLKLNVDDLKLIQVGLTLSNNLGELPDFGTPCSYIWEFNFCDFEIDSDPYAEDSVALLKKQGIDFEKNRVYGIHSAVFAQYLLHSPLICNYSFVTWVTFHSAYDFGYLVKVLIRRPLPQELGDFLRLVEFYFGSNVYDVKYLMKFCDNLYGGLERVAESLNVERAAGKCHQAGSDSLLTLHTFMKMRDRFFQQVDLNGRYGGVLFGLEVN